MRVRSRIVAACLLSACGVAACVSPPAGSNASTGEVVVSAASSLTTVMRDIAARYDAASGDRIAINAGPSNTLARQIAAGARVDLFVSADEAQMNVAESQIVAGTRIDLLSNQLVIAVPDDRARQLHSVRDLLQPAFRRIAIGDPAAVPAGVYARTYLESVGIWSALQPKLVPSGSVRLALAAVESGVVDAGIVYRTDVATAHHVTTAFVMPVAEGPVIVYPAAVIRSGNNQEGGRRFLAFLQSDTASSIFERAGFIPLHHTRADGRRVTGADLKVRPYDGSARVTRADLKVRPYENWALRRRRKVRPYENVAHDRSSDAHAGLVER